MPFERMVPGLIGPRYSSLQRIALHNIGRRLEKKQLSWLAAMRLRRLVLKQDYASLPPWVLDNPKPPVELDEGEF